MTHFNLNRMLQGCSAFIQTMTGDCPLQLRRIALILCVLVMSMANVGMAWGVDYSSTPVISADFSGMSDGAPSAISGITYNGATISSGKLTWTNNWSEGSRDVQLTFTITGTACKLVLGHVSNGSSKGIKGILYKGNTKTVDFTSSAWSLTNNATSSEKEFTGLTSGTYTLKLGPGGQSARDVITSIAIYDEDAGGGGGTTYTVTYKKNGAAEGADGTVTGTTTDASSPYASGAEVTTIANGYSRSGYKFKWWNKNYGGDGEDFYVGEKFNISANTNLYAQWEEVPSGWEFWVGDNFTFSSNVMSVGDMRITKSSSGVSTYEDVTNSNTVVSKFSSTDKHAKALAITSNGKYVQVHFSDESPINTLKLGVITDQTSAKNIVVNYCTTADFSTGEHEFKKVGETNNVVSVPAKTQTSKSMTDVSPSTANKYKYVRIYRKLGSGSDGNGTGGELGSGNNTLIYAIKAQKGEACSAPSSVAITGTNKYLGGQTISLTATPSGGSGTATYQWQKEINSVWTNVTNGGNITGATSANLQISSCTHENSGQYRCIVSTGATCSTTSSAYGVHVFSIYGKYYSGEYSHNEITWTSGTTGTATIHLNASSTYLFKVWSNDGYYYGNGENNYIIQPVNWDCGTGNHEMRLFTGPEGDYTFTVNIEHGLDGSPYVNLQVAYPSVTHPVTGYVYLTKWWSCYPHFWDGSSNALSPNGYDPLIATYTTICGTDYWYMPALDNYTNVYFKDNATWGSATNHGDETSITGNSGKYYTHDGSSWDWHSFTTYTISFANGGGTGTMSAMANLCPGDDPVLPANTFEKTGYTFNGWKTNVAITANSAAVAADGAVAAGATINDIATDITLTAQWSCIDFTPGRGGTADGTYTVGEDGGALTCSVAAAGSYTYQWKQYTSGQAEGDAVDAVGSGATTTSFTPHPTSAGTYYYFCAVTNECGTTKNCATSGTFVFNAAATLYTVTYNVNGAGSVTPASATQASAEAAVTLPTPTWSGYTFEGWYNNGTKIGNGGASYTPTADITLYAHWTDNISGKVFSFIDNNYGDKFKGFDGETLVSGNATGKDKTYTNGTTGVQFVVEDGAWDGKSNAIASLAKLVNGTSMSVVIPTGKKATVKISYGAYNTGNQLTVGGNNQTAPTTALTDGMTNAQVNAALQEITLNNQTGTLTLGSSTGNIYIGRVSATITGYTVTHTLSNVSKTSGETSAAANTDYTAVYSAVSGYELPDAISVTIGGVAQTAGTGYTWTKATGTVTIPAAYVTGAIVITVTGVEESGDSGDCIEWAGTPGSLTDGAMTVSTNLQLSVSEASIASDKVWDGSGNKTLFKIDGSDKYVQGHFVDDSEISTVTVSAATNQTDAKKYAIVFCANSSFSSGVTVQTHTAPSASSTRNDANLIHEFTAPAGTKYFRIYRRYVLSETQYGDNQTIRVYGVEVCPAACSNPVIDESATKASFAGGSWAQNSGHTITITATGASSYEWYRNTSANDAGATKLSETSNALDITADVATGTYFYKAVAKSGACSSSTEWGWCGAMTITAPTTYTVTYNGSSADGGSVPEDASSPYTSGSTVTVLGNTGSLTRSIEGDAATFYGWNTNSNMYGGTHYNAGETFSITANTTLYAVWGYTITWNLNDGEWVDYTAPTYYIYGQGLTLPTAAKISRSGYTFDHWELAYNNSTISTIADDATGNVTLNAIWTADASSYSVTYNGNDNTGGSVPTDATSYSAGDIVTVKGNTGSLVKTGQTFLGWSTSATASSGTFYPADYKFEMPASAVTLYAVWGTGQVCYTLTDFQTSSNNKSDNKPDSEGKYFYGYMGTKDAEHALTITATNGDCIGQNSGANLKVYGGKYVNIYADNTTTGGTPATFSNVTSVSIKAKVTNASYIATFDIMVGSTTIADDVSLSAATSSFQTYTYDNLSNLNGKIKIINNNGGSSSYSFLVDDIEICTGSGSSGYTVTFDNNGEGEYSRTITNVPSGSKIGVPIPAPTADGNTFGGWYKENTCTNAWNFASDVVNSDKTLYAKWTNCAPTITTQPVAASYAQNATATALTVAANNNGGGELHYQWWVKENDLDEETGSAIPGETGTNFTPSTTLLGTIYYYCVVSNDCGNVFSSTAGITITDARPNPKANWDVAVPTHGGKGFSFSVEVNKNDDSDWDGTLDASMLTLSSNAVLDESSIEVDNTNKTISGTYGVLGSATSPVTFYLLLPATATQAAARLDYNKTFTTCTGGGDGSTYRVPVRKDSEKDASNNYRWVTAGAGEISYTYGSTISSGKATSSYNSFDSIVSSDKQNLYVRTYNANIKKVTLYVLTGGKDITVESIYKQTSYKGADDKDKLSTAAYSVTYDDGSDENTGAKGNHYIVITLEDPLKANDILMFKFSKSNVKAYGAVFTQTADGGTETPTLGWSPSIDGNVEKNENAADFTYTATRSNDEAVASLGIISYSSSNTTVATVNATTGQVTIADNIDFGSADHIDVTITATLSASGCYKKATTTYTLRVKKYVCTEAAGTVTVTSESGCGKVLTISGYEEDASIQWYKDGEVITGATKTTYTATSGGTYYAITHKGCDAVSNELTISTAAATATKIVDSWYVKNGRRTPDIALVQTTNATGFTVTTGSPASDITSTGIGGCTFELKDDGIIYLHGTKDNGDAPSDMTPDDITIRITATACSNATPLDIVLHIQPETAKPEIAFVVDGTLRKDGGTAISVLPAKTSERPIWEFLSDYYALTGCNAYWSVNSKELRQYYSQFDAILITDDPNTSTKGTGGVSYVKAFGTMVDVRPVLTMEAYVGKFEDGGWHVYNATPSSPNPRQVEMKLECKNHDIFVGLNPSTMDNVRTETINGDEYWFVTMVDTTQSPYHNTKDDYEALPALQGFDKTKFSNMLGVGTIKNDELQAGVERQEEPAARMMILGIQNNAMAALTTEGKMVVKNALDYLLKTDMEDVNDCANYFLGTTNNQWNVASNWSRNEVPDFETRARILRPVVVPNDFSTRVARVDIASDGPSKKLGGAECTGSLTISQLGALVVSGKVSRVHAPYYGVNNLMPTRVSDVAILSGTAGNGTLIMDDASGENKAYVQMYSKAVKSENTTWQYIGIPHSDVGNAMDNYYDSWLYSWSPSAGWEVVPRGAAVTPWTGYCITYPTYGHKYEMEGTLVATADVDIDVPANSYQIIGNSWVAPIQIANFEDEDFGDITKTVYFFNTGSDTGGSGTVSENATGATRWAAGTYVSVPIHMAEYGEDQIIPSMQGFYVANTGSAGTLHLDYDKLVRQHGVSNYIQGQMHAPRRIAKASNDPVMLKMIVRGSRYDDRLIVAEREDFTKGHDDGWDGAKWDGSTISPTIWSQNDEGGVESVTATPDMEGTIIGFRAGEDNEYTFHFEYDDMAEPLFLLDTDERMYVRILTGTTYTFTCADKGEHNRFLLTRKAPGIPTGCEPIDGGGGPKAMKFIKDNKLYILLNGVLYDATGKVVE